MKPNYKTVASSKNNSTGLNLNWEEFKEFLIIDKNRSENPSAINSDKSRFNIIKQWFSNKEWNAINFRGLLSHYKEQGKSRGTRNKLISMGRLLDEYLETSISKTFKTKAEKSPRVKDVLTSTEMLSLADIKMNYAKHHRHLNQRSKVLIMLLTLTGCRINEALGLCWDDMREASHKYVVFRNTKNGDDRLVPIPDNLFDSLANLPHRSDYIFTSNRGKKLYSQDFNRDLKRRTEKVGINKNVYPHLFRHSFVTIMLERGMAESDICKIVGWRDQRALMRYKNSKLDYYAEIMQIHPLLQAKMSFKDRGERCLREINKFLEFGNCQILTDLQEKRLTIEIIQN